MKSITTLLKTTVPVLAAIFLGTGFAHADIFDWENLQSDIHGVARLTDPNLVNPWGIARSDWDTIFVANNGTGTATQYCEDGTPSPSFDNPLVITIRLAQRTLKARIRPAQFGTGPPRFV